MAKINFIIRAKVKDNKNKLVTIYVNVNNGREQRITLKTEYKIPIKFWNKKRQEVVQKHDFESGDYTIINQYLSDIKIKIGNHINEMNRQYKPITYESVGNLINNQPKDEEEIVIPTINEYISRFIEKTTDCSILTEKGNKYSKGTIRNYKQLLRLLFEYSENEIPFSKIDRQFGEDFIGFLTQKGYSKNYTGRIISRIKSIMNRAKKEGLVDVYDYMDYKVYKESVFNIFLTIEELHRMMDLDLSHDKSMEKVRDIFVFGCFIGQRISDYNTGKAFILENGDNNIKLLKIIQQKTNAKVTIPLRKEPLEILRKYNYQLPKVSPQRINKLIKQIGLLARIDNEIEYETTVGGIIRKRRIKKYDLIKTHTARRSMITNMVISGKLNTHHMMLISGHKKEIDFYNYVKAGYDLQFKNIDYSFFMDSFS